jgi:hypothetical protein
VLQIAIVLDLYLQLAHAARYAYCDVCECTALFDDVAKAVLQQWLKSERGNTAGLRGGVDFPRNRHTVGETRDHDVCVSVKQRQFVGQRLFGMLARVGGRA